MFGTLGNPGLSCVFVLQMHLDQNLLEQMGSGQNLHKAWN